MTPSPQPGPARTPSTINRPGVALLTISVLAAVGWVVASTGRGVWEIGAGLASALWTLGIIVPVHLVQLFLSAAAWRDLLPEALPGLPTCFRLRTVREAINSLLPVARVGGEVVAARWLAGRGMALPVAGASIIVDVTIELVTQGLFLLGGLAGLAALGGAGIWGEVASAAVATLAAASLLLLALRFGLLRLVEALTRQIARRLPQVGSLDGLEAAARAIAERPSRLLRAGGIHMLTWIIGAIETWVVLRALGHRVSVAEALVIESLGAAARSAGFAVPGALGVQEGGYMLVVAAFGLPQSAGLSLSLIKRVREVLIGLVGLVLWRWPADKHSPVTDPAGI